MTRLRSRNGLTGNGFSLLELLVVILIIGLAVGLVSFSGGGNNSAYQLREELRFFANTLGLLAEEASLSGDQYGVDFYWDMVDGEEVYGYRWLKLDIPQIDEEKELNTDPDSVANIDGDNRVQTEIREEQWLPYTPVDFEQEGLFSGNYLLRIEVDGIELEIMEKLIPEEIGKLDAEVLLPDIWLFSSGEVTPFKLSLVDREVPELYQEIHVDMLGRMSLETEEE